MLKNRSTPFLAFLQTTGFVTYLVLISLFFNFVVPNFNGSEPESFYAPILMLLLFVISAVISGTLILGRAAVLFWEKKYKEAFSLIGWTLGWGILYFTILVLALYNK